MNLYREYQRSIGSVAPGRVDQNFLKRDLRIPNPESEDPIY